MAKRCWPDTMLSQILVLMALASLVMVLAGAVASYFISEAFDKDLSIMNSHFVSVAVAKLNETPAEERDDVLTELSREVPDLTINFVDDTVLAAFEDVREGARFGPFMTGDTLLGMRLEHVVGPQERGGNAPPVLYFRLRDGSLVSAEWGFPGLPPLVGLPFYLFFGFLVLAVGGLMIWAARGLVGPISDLANSAGSFGETSTNPVPIREYGPREVRTAAHAFNRMQLRINDILEKRTRMLAAISHDLRTPLTRLRLRLDLLEDGETRDRSLEDLDTMDRQINTALTFLRDGRSSEPVQRIDIPSFLQSLSNKYADTGRPVNVRFKGSLAIMARNLELEGALSNLIDNAIKYASSGEISACKVGDRIRIDVIDHGSGIPEHDRARLLEPFERGDNARQIQEGTGFGLGLSISQAIVEAASGTLELKETVGGGLTVRLEFPAC